MKKNSMYRRNHKQKDPVKKKIYYFKETDLDKYIENLDSKEKIVKSIANINQEIVNVGKVCDDLLEKSSKEYEEILNIERDKLNREIEYILKRLEEYLNQWKIEKETDFKGIYREISQKLKKVSKEISTEMNKLQKAEKKQKDADENEHFYDIQIKNAKDLNMYLKHKMSILSNEGEKNEITKEKEQEKTNENEEQKKKGKGKGK